MRVPILDLTRQHAPLRAEIDRAIARVIDSGRFILGAEVEGFEAETARVCNAAFAIGVSSGTDALLAALMALDIGPGDEVVTTALSFFATAGAVARLGAKPVFADVRSDFNIDPDDALRRVTSRTKAILPVSLFGRRAEVERLAESGLPVIEDAAQAIGAPHLGRGAKMATLSFFPSKNLGALGDAGAVLTDDPKVADRLRLLRAHGSKPKYVHHVVGGNFRIDALQAAVLRVKLPHLAAWNVTRRANMERYRTALANDAAAFGLALPEDAPGHIWHHFCVRVGAGRRDALKTHLQERGIETEVYYPNPLHLQPCFAYLGGKPGDLPGAESATREALAIPVHPELDAAQIDHVIASLREFFAVQQ
ncbi:MAG: transcriptional regulator [Myxococcales bacterium]|nr:transcriptional regulator [Myxococcales bacterium]